MLTLDQIIENNSAAKEMLIELLKMKNKLELHKTQRKLLPLGTRILDYIFNINKIQHEQALTTIVCSMEHELKFYFKMHYSHGTMYSSRMSPKVQYCMYTDNILWTTRKTTSFNVIPHPMNKL